jgi:hypothetical protein
MGTKNATLLSAVPNTNWVTATFLWVTARRLTQPSPAPGQFVYFFCSARQVSSFPGSPNPSLS